MQLARNMQLAKVIGDVVVTRKDDNLTGSRCSCCSRSPPTASNVGRTLVAVDAVGAGVGETVFFVRGKEASFPFYPDRGSDRCRHRGHRRSLCGSTSS